MSDAGAAAVTEDRLLDGRVVLRQPASGYRAAIDPVLLAAAMRPRPDDRVLDLGCGVGAASLCLAARVADCRIVGLEIQPHLAEHARHNAAANGFGARIEIIEGDLTRPPPALAAGGFDQVMTNPPFLEAGAHTPSPHPSRAAATHEQASDLEAWIGFSHAMLRPKGWLTLIHRADRLDAICALLNPRFGAVTLIPLWPKPGLAARRVIVRARKGVRSPATLAAGLALHGPVGDYTPEANLVLRAGAAIEG